MKKTGEECILCAPGPCTCGAQGRKSRPKKPSESRSDTVVVSSSPKPRSGARFQQYRKPETSTTQTVTSTTPVTSRFAVEQVETEPSQDELELREAIRNLGPLLHPSERRRYAALLDPAIPTKTEHKLVDWRKRNGLD